MRATFATEPERLDKPTEDWILASSDLAVILDGATARTDTGCVHGVAWYSHQLGAAIVSNAAVRALSLVGGLAQAVERVAILHPQCDLSHPGTPSAAVGVIRVIDDVLEYLVLGDVTIAVRTASDLTVVTDDRVNRTAHPHREEAERLPIGSPEKAEALLRMKHGELAARNRPGGYWVAASDPGVAEHAITGQVSLRDVVDLAACTDGAARIVTPFHLFTWTDVLDLLHKNGPDELIRCVRDAEATDPHGVRWPRNKRSDDITTVYMDGFNSKSPLPT
jgi:hypothetical protein